MARRPVTKYWPVELGARQLGISREALYRSIRRGTVRAVHFRGQYWIPASTLERLQKRRGTNPMGKKSYAQVVEELKALDQVAEVLEDVDDDKLTDEQALDEIAELVGFEWAEEEGD